MLALKKTVICSSCKILLIKSDYKYWKHWRMNNHYISMILKSNFFLKASFNMTCEILIFPQNLSQRTTEYINTLAVLASWPRKAVFHTFQVQLLFIRSSSLRFSFLCNAEEPLPYLPDFTYISDVLFFHLIFFLMQKILVISTSKKVYLWHPVEDEYILTESKSKTGLKKKVSFYKMRTKTPPLKEKSKFFFHNIKESWTLLLFINLHMAH